MILKNRSQKFNWLQLVIIFILGILIASNGFLLWNNMALQNEISKLKTDDLVLAQAINRILNQVKPAQTVPSQPVNPAPQK
ncbi:MAG: hypothetical protein NTX82_06850 [Candidatus Parcubacteria bacterium]|nr:hypothetical protein [Candidatus Parcubacteria bacterium]